MIECEWNGLELCPVEGYGVAGVNVKFLPWLQTKNWFH
jgi:hypothetical protein